LTESDSNNKQSHDGRNVGERNFKETRKNHLKVINLSKRNLTESEVKLLKKID
jgi:ubiquitin